MRCPELKSNQELNIAQGRKDIMFELVIEHRTTESVTAHTSRELALAAFLKFLDAVGCDYRVASACWTQSSYQIFEPARPGDRARLPVPIGRAVIAQLCRCGHTPDHHDSCGCTEQPLAATDFGHCDCRLFDPAPGDPMLFDIEKPGHSSTAVRAGAGRAGVRAAS